MLTLDTSLARGESLQDQRFLALRHLTLWDRLQAHHLVLQERQVESDHAAHVRVRQVHLLQLWLSLRDLKHPQFQK